MGFSLVRDVFPKRYVALGASLAFTGSGLVSIFGPFLAGWLEDSFGVLAVFWFAAIFQTVCLAGLLLTVPESPVRVRARLDWVGAALLGLGSVGLVYAIGQGSIWGWTSARFIGLAAAGIAFFVGWLAWDARFSDPLIEIALLRTSRVKSTLLLTFLAFATMGPIGAILPNLLQTPKGVGGNYGFGIDAYGVARYSIAMGLLTALGGFLVGTQARRWGIRGPMIFGVACLGGAAAGLATLPSSPATMITLMGLLGLGTGFTSACIPNLMLQSVPPTAQGISATTQVTASNLGQVVTTQLAFAILTAHVVSGSTYAYSANGYTLAFAIAAGCAVIALIGCALMPHGRRQDVVNSAVGYEAVGREEVAAV
jgi:MFS family permease